MTSEVEQAVARAVAPLEHRIAQLEQQLDWLFVQQGYDAPNGTTSAPAAAPWPYAVSPRVVELLRAGDDIAAIKQARVDAGLGLVEAKRLCDGVREQLAREG